MSRKTIQIRTSAAQLDLIDVAALEKAQKLSDVNLKSKK